MNFLELTKQFEDIVRNDFELELLENHYMPYSFGSGTIVYRIRGRLVKLIYDGKDFIARLLISAKHTKYPNSDWTEVFSGSSLELLDVAGNNLKDQLFY